MRNRRGVSGVITTVLLIGLVVVVVAVVWGVVMNLVQENVDSTSSCFGNFNKVELNNQYTCYDSTSNELSFSVSVGDIDLEKVIVLISGGGTTQSVELSATGPTKDYLKPYGGSYGGAVTMPGSNGGKTYVMNLAHVDVGITGKPDVIKIKPVISGTQCEVSDSISNIEPCQTTI